MQVLLTAKEFDGRCFLVKYLLLIVIGKKKMNSVVDSQKRCFLVIQQLLTGNAGVIDSQRTRREVFSGEVSDTDSNGEKVESCNEQSKKKVCYSSVAVNDKQCRCY